MIFNKIIIGSVIAMIELITLTSCYSVTTSSEIPTPRPDYDCSSLPAQKSSGWQWNGITIGVSNKDDLIRQFGHPESDGGGSSVISSCMEKYYYYDLKLRISMIKGIVDEIEISTYTMASDKLKNIKWRPDGLPETLYDAKALYGEPDIVGFGDLETRYILWKQLGVMVFVDKVIDSSFLDQSELLEVDFLSPQAVDRVLSNTKFGVVSEMIPQSGVYERNLFDGWERWQPKRDK